MKANHVYVVTAYRWGDPECHSYVVGVFGKKVPAQKCAEMEEDCRGGKYSCEILEIPVGVARRECEWKIIKPIEDLRPRKTNETL